MTQVLHESDVTIVAVDTHYDSLDEAKLDQFSKLLLSTVDRAKTPVVLLDLAEADFIGSTFLGILVRAWKRLRDRQGRLALCHVNQVCGDVLRASKLDTIWEIFPSREAAVRELAETP
ncbi:MAG TPA: STAS domain-containing protein [Pirellulales bacterium]|nr:STAS domain-containing protein [Pirellulales bacterium]